MNVLSPNCPPIFPLNLITQRVLQILHLICSKKIHIKLVSQIGHHIFSYKCQIYCSIQFSTQLSRQISHLIFQPYFANNFSDKIFNNIFYPFLSYHFLTQLFQHNFPEHKIVHVILHQVVQLNFTHKPNTHLCHTLCQSIFPTPLPYSFNTVSQILYTESLSTAIHTETKKVMQEAAVGGKEKLLYMGDTAFLNIWTS